MKRCPFCKEEIQDEAVKCKHCHEFLGEQPQREAGKQWDQKSSETRTTDNGIGKNKDQILKKSGRKLSHTLGWIFGVLLLASGIFSIFGGEFVGIFMILISAVLIPPIIKMIGTKFGRKISTPEKVVSVLILLLLTGLVAPDSQDTSKEIAQISYSSSIENNNKIDNKKILADYQNEVIQLSQNSSIMLKKMQAAIDAGEMYAAKNYGKKLVYRNLNAIQNQNTQQSEINQLRKDIIASHESAIRIYNEMKKINPDAATVYNSEIQKLENSTSRIKQARIRTLNDILNNQVKSSVL